MIKDELTNSQIYFSLSERIKRGLEWLNSQNLDNISDGKYQIDGDKIYANVQTYETKEDADYEAHRKYIDIQYVVKGSEYIGVVPYEICKTKVKYDTEKDIEFLTCQENIPYQILKSGEFLILFPHDAHKPSIMIDKKQTVKKIVVKVSV